MREVTYNDPTDKGKSIHQQAEDAIQYARKYSDWNGGIRVLFKFNDIQLVAYDNSNVADIVEKYSLQSRLTPVTQSKQYDILH